MPDLINITLSKLRQQLGNVVTRISHTNGRVVILCRGRALAAIVPISDYDALEEADAKSLQYKEYQMAEQMARWNDLKQHITRERARRGADT